VEVFISHKCFQLFKRMCEKYMFQFESYFPASLPICNLFFGSGWAHSCLFHLLEQSPIPSRVWLYLNLYGVRSGSAIKLSSCCDCHTILCKAGSGVRRAAIWQAAQQAFLYLIPFRSVCLICFVPFLSCQGISIVSEQTYDFAY
jgi:hypothetical protein